MQMSSNRITAAEASNLANSSTQFDKDYILDQVYQTVKANLKNGSVVLLYQINSVSILEMEAAVRQLKADGYQANATHSSISLKLEVRWPV